MSFFKSKNAILFHKNIIKLRNYKNMLFFINKPMMMICCISSYFSFVICQRRGRQKAFFGDIFPKKVQKAEPQHRI